VSGTRGPGLTTTFTGTSTEFSRGGLGSRNVGVAGATNTGNGGDGAARTGNVSRNGGSGVVYVRYRR
jgi:hypothetical protein